MCFRAQFAPDIPMIQMTPSICFVYLYVKSWSVLLWTALHALPAECVPQCSCCCNKQLSIFICFNDRLGSIQTSVLPQFLYLLLSCILFYVAYPVPTPTHLPVCTNNLLLRVSVFTFSSTFLCFPPHPTYLSNIIKNRSRVQSLPSVNKHAKWLHRHIYYFLHKMFISRCDVVYIGRSVSIF
jgi:hypothetical protein